MESVQRKSILISAFLILVVFAAIILSFFNAGKKAESEWLSQKEMAVIACESLCREVKGDIDFNRGPCLSDKYAFAVRDWVCDIAHNPRSYIDNMPENQCRDFREGKAHHFVELDENCQLIRAV
ncbi:hypothetical protein DRN74_02780 [Candidatus Micrarchaeota archaeon]|nr:MAG: hypothetical protein DRN74_02780 [Candidatus Micrarchaeota archaeon]